MNDRKACCHCGAKDKYMLYGCVGRGCDKNVCIDCAIRGIHDGEYYCHDCYDLLTGNDTSEWKARAEAAEAKLAALNPDKIVEAVAALLADPTGRYRFNDTFAAMLRQQAARIKELEAQVDELTRLEKIIVVQDLYDLAQFYLSADTLPTQHDIIMARRARLMEAWGIDEKEAQS